MEIETTAVAEDSDDTEDGKGRVVARGDGDNEEIGEGLEDINELEPE